MTITATIDPRHTLATLLGDAAYHPAVIRAFCSDEEGEEPLDILVARAVAGAEGGANTARILAVRAAVIAVSAWIAEDPWFRGRCDPDDVTATDSVASTHYGARDRA